MFVSRRIETYGSYHTTISRRYNSGSIHRSLIENFITLNTSSLSVPIAQFLKAAAIHFPGPILVPFSCSMTRYNASSRLTIPTIAFTLFHHFPLKFPKTKHAAISCYSFGRRKNHFHIQEDQRPPLWLDRNQIIATIAIVIGAGDGRLRE